MIDPIKDSDQYFCVLNYRQLIAEALRDDDDVPGYVLSGGARGGLQMLLRQLDKQIAQYRSKRDERYERERQLEMRSGS